MKHLRKDYDAIQPWPTKRPHIVKVGGKPVELPPCQAKLYGGPGHMSAHECERHGTHEVHWNSFYDGCWRGDKAFTGPFDEVEEIELDYPGDEPLIPDDEPVFLLRAKDKLAPEAMRAWCQLLLDAGGNPNLSDRVASFAREMEEYARDHYDRGKLPDTPKDMLR